MLPQFHDGLRAQRHHHDPRAMDWELFVTSDARRRAGRARVRPEPIAAERARAGPGFWVGLVGLLGRVRNRK